VSQQTPEAKLSRLRAMVSDHGETWDLSGNDQDAIQYALDLMDKANEPVSNPTPIDWPSFNSANTYWWMRYKLKPRSKPKIMLVSMLIAEGTEYVQPFQDRNCYPRSFCKAWQAEFIPCETPPFFG
jgi:hypothetical protein